MSRLFALRAESRHVLVFRLREKIDRGFDQKLLHTVRGAGYVLKVG